MANSDISLKLAIEGEKQFKSALADINRSFRVLGSEMQMVTSQFDKNDKSVNALTSRNTVLNKEISAQKDKIETLKSALDNASSSFGENDKRTQEWQIKLNKAQAELNGMERELGDNNKALEKADKSLDSAGKETDEFGKSVDKAGDEIDETGKETNKLGKEMDETSKKTSVLGGSLAVSAVRFTLSSHLLSPIISRVFSPPLFAKNCQAKLARKGLLKK